MPSDDSGLSYEDQRLQNIKDNEALLLSLGLNAATTKIVPPKPKVVKPKPAASLRKSLSIKRKLEAAGDELRTPKRKTADEHDGVDTPESEGSSIRRSGRNSGRKVDYSNDGFNNSPRASPSLRGSRPSSLLAGNGSKAKVEPEDDDAFIDDDENYRGGMEPQRKAQRMGVRTQDPKQFGHIPGVEVGRWWVSRMDCSTDAIHAPTVAGISGNEVDGAWSVALSGGYPDDVDLGEAFTYTGSGGRDLKGTKNNPKNLRTAPQTSDQSFSNPKNAALKRSAETRKPVRVIRGFKLDSVYAPAEGYRYDGLYTVEKAWMAKGLTRGVVGGKSRALMVCRYAFKRVPGQPDLIVRGTEEPEGDES